MTKSRKKSSAAAQPAVKRQVRMTPKDATHLVDKNSKTMTKIIELVALAQTEACKTADQQRLIDRKIELLKMRLNKRLVKLSKWVDVPESDRLPLPVFRQVPSIYLPKGPRGVFATRGVPAHVLLENAYSMQVQAASAQADGGARPDLAATLQRRAQYSERETTPWAPPAAQGGGAPMGWRNPESAESLRDSLNLHSLLPPARVTILPGRKINKDTGERVTSEEQEMCECGTAYTYHNKARHLKSFKHTEYVTKKEKLLSMAAAAQENAAQENTGE